MLMTCRSSFSDWGTNPNPLQCKHEVLTTELPGKPFSFYIALSSELGKIELCVCVHVYVYILMRGGKEAWSVVLE